MSRRQLLSRGLGLFVLLACAWPAVAAFTTVAGLFQAGHYDEARAALAANDEGARPGEEILWRSRLATDPAVALSLLETAVGDEHYSPEVNLRLALEIADLHAGRGDHRAVLKALQPVLDRGEPDIPGAVYLRAGLALRALGQLQRAREMLASVRPGDQDFVLARYYLGDIALEQNDVSLAHRYFKAAEQATTAGGRSRLASGIWLAHHTAGENKAADELVTDLQQDDPGSLSLLEIRRLQQMEADERQARAGTATADSVVTPIPDLNGRYALQLGAFSDRALALEYVRRLQDRLPDLRIDKARDDRGQFLYKVRTGMYVNPALARSEAKQLQRKLGVEVIVADLSTDGGPSR